MRHHPPPGQDVCATASSMRRASAISHRRHDHSARHVRRTAPSTRANSEICGTVAKICSAVECTGAIAPSVPGESCTPAMCCRLRHHQHAGFRVESVCPNHARAHRGGREQPRRRKANDGVGSCAEVTAWTAMATRPTTATAAPAAPARCRGSAAELRDPRAAESADARNPYVT